MGLARMLLKCSYGLTDHNRVDRSTAQSPSVKVKGLHPMVKLYRVRRDGGTGGRGGSNATGASHRALIYAGSVVACPKRRDASSGRGPPHGRR